MAKLIHILNKSTFDSKVDELSPDSIVFIKDTKQIWTHGLLYSCPLSLEEINTLLENKADISDLSNVLAEEVIDEPLLSEINTLTREEIKKDLFIDMWNRACESYGRYNAETGYFELNGLTDITYEQALEIYENGRTKYPYPSTIGRRCRTNLLLRTVWVYYQNYWPTSLKNLTTAANIEVLRIADDNTIVSVNNMDGLLFSCKKLKKIIGILNVDFLSQLRQYDWEIAPSLEEMLIDHLHFSLNIKNMKLLNFTSFQYMIANAANTSPITITVHPDVYSKITDTNNAEWYKLLTDANAKNISFATV